MKFEEVMKINVNEKTEKKGNLTYLSWAWAWAEFKKIYPEATYEVKKFDGLPYVHDRETGYMVYTSVTAEGITYEMWLPVMDARNKTLMEATMFDINKTIMRCLAKNLAMFGLGLYIYAGEDLPEEEQPVKQNTVKSKVEQDSESKEEGQNTVATHAVSLEDALETKVVIRGTEYVFGKLPQNTLEWYAEKSKNAELREKAALVLQHKFAEELKNGAEETPFGR